MNTLNLKNHLRSSLTGADKKDVLLLGFQLFGFCPDTFPHKEKGSRFWADAPLTVWDLRHLEPP